MQRLRHSLGEELLDVERAVGVHELGRNIKANAAWANLDDAHAKLYEQVRQIFDPFSTLNPGVKQKTDIRTLVAALRASYDSSSVL